MNKVKKWIILPDMHVPYEDRRTMVAVEKYMAAHVWQGYLNLGDFLDFDSISTFNTGRPGNIEGKRLEVDYAWANKILDRHQKIIRARNRKAQFVMLEGNHEERMERFFETMPQLKGGPLSVDRAMKFKERGFKWVRSWSKGEIFSLGKANFVHGQYTNQYHPAKMVTKYGDNVIYGHTHDIMSHAIANQMHPEKVIMGQSLGCLCERDQAYMKGKPSSWMQGFGVIHLYPDGKFSLYVVRIFNHRFIGPDGASYEG